MQGRFPKKFSCLLYLCAEAVLNMYENSSTSSETQSTTEPAMASPLPILLSITTFIFLISSPSPASGLCDNKERDSLLLIKSSLGNPPSLSSWNATADCCTSWVGISCDDVQSKHVVAISIRNNKDINGTIPPEIGNLPEIYTIALERLPGLHGEIPITVGRLSKLEFIYISHTKLSGNIPESLGKLKIAHFDFHHCKLTGPIPASITQIPTLRRLDLSHNTLSGQIPPFTSKLSTSLTDLDLSHNKLFGKIPASVGYLTKLDTLVLSFNKLSGAIPTNLPTQLSKIDVGNNQLTGGIQQSFRKFTQLLEIDLSMNLLQGDASMLFNINPSWLQSLNISWNSFSFDLGSVKNFSTDFWKLDASHNQLYGVIPASLGNVKTMWTLYLSYNRLSGDIHADRLPGSLTWARLDHNGFTGKIPQSLGNNTNLLEIDLSHNKFSGDASFLFHPDEITQVINLSWNMLSFNLTKVKFSFGTFKLDLSHNRIYGSIPSQIVTLQVLEEFDVSYNLLTGEIPQGGKMQSFNRSAFEHNPGLCGYPLDRCPGRTVAPN